MRIIDLAGETPPNEWLEKARAVTDKLEAAKSKEERDKLIDAHSAIWGELKPWLLKFSRGKCWFSEARDYFSHWDVEHYRPKKAARDIGGEWLEDGYWWLAFDWRNFRVCGNVGNRKKGEYFPLRSGTHRATAANRNIDDELPYLLDPVRPDDPILLCFDENGDVKPSPELDGWQTARAEESIKRYKLREHEPLMEGRRDVWSRCTREINLCQNLMEEQNTSPSATKKEAVRQQVVKLVEMVKSNAEFSAVACECLLTRKERWAQRLATESLAS